MIVPKQQRSLKYIFLHIPLILREDAWVPASIIGIIALFIHDKFDLANIPLILGLLIGFSFAYMVNDYFDSEADQQDQTKAKNNFFVYNSISKSITITGSALVFFTLLMIFSSFGFSGYTFLLISLLMIYLYSSPWINFKSKPPFDIITHAIFIHTYPYFLVVYLTIGRFRILDLYIMAALFLASFIIQLENQVRDYDVDIITSHNSTISWGLPRSIQLIKILTIILSIVALIGFFLFKQIRFLIPYGMIYSPVIFQRVLYVQNNVRSQNLLKLVGVLGIIYTLILITHLL